ncbi:hypothetical protein KCU62_g5576, partial [Aureobasidium sp. EXF-3399]
MSIRNSITGPSAETTVGKDSSAAVFNLPKQLLCESSTYFEAALNNGFAETATQKITLDDDDDHPEIFRTYAAWLFERELSQESIGEVADVEHHLFFVYIFADKRGIRRLANDVVTKMSSLWVTQSIDLSTTVECLPLLLPGCTLYELTLDNLILASRAGTAAVAGPTAKVVVGSGANAKPFYVHKQLLCDSSTYFTTALNDGFAETKHQTIKLDDEDPDIFLTYVLWLYGGKLSREALPSDQTEGPFENHLFKLYVFADKRGVKNLANNTITMLAAHWVQKCVTMSEVAWVVLLLSPNDKLYELIQDHLILELREEILDEPKHLLAAMDLPKEFLFNLLRRSGKLGKQFERAHHCFEAWSEWNMSLEQCKRAFQEFNTPLHDQSRFLIVVLEYPIGYTSKLKDCHPQLSLLPDDSLRFTTGTPQIVHPGV